MFIVHEGEIIYKEKYGSYPKKRFYVKPPDQADVLVVVDEGKTNEFTNLFKKIFLPQGFPDSVSRDYLNYQIWDTAQAFCSTITGILATQEVLRGVGVGDTSATPLAATITWVLKDGCGHLGKIFFAYSHGSHLDSYSKMWRLYADALNDAAMCLEIALPVFKNFTTIILCASTVMKAIVGVAGGATRAAMTQHHAIRGNLADVLAKDSAQETAVNLTASITALLIITLFGNSLTIFILMLVCHIIFNYLAVRAVCLRTMNEPRFLHIIDTYLRREIISKPCAVNKNEPIVSFNIGPESMDQKLCGFRIRIGHSIKKLIKKNPKANYLKNVQEVYKFNEYILFPSIPTREIYICLLDSATTDDILCSYFHAVLYSIIICAINDYDLAIYKSPENTSRPFPVICETLKASDWSRVPIETLCEHFSYEPTIELMAYLNRTVVKEWPKISAGLEQLGWDLKKHLLTIEEWRICTEKKHEAKKIPVGEQINPEILERTAKKTCLDTAYHDNAGDVKTYTIEPDKLGGEESEINTLQGTSR